MEIKKNNIFLIIQNKINFMNQLAEKYILNGN